MSLRFPPNLPWELLDAALNGVSAIDLGPQPVRTREEAMAFLHHYGYDLDRPEHAGELRAFLDESRAFLSSVLLTPNVVIPPAVHDCPDIIALMRMAGPDGPQEPRLWACSLLKIIHTLAHLHHSPQVQALPDARRQILSMVDAIIQPDGDGGWRMCPPPGTDWPPLPLVLYQTKDAKRRDSMLLKLLCKKEMVAEEVRDLVGFRLVTRTPAEAVLAIHRLFAHHILVLPNLIPSRTHNALVSFQAFREAYWQLALSSATVDEFWPALAARVLPQADQSDTARFPDHNPASVSAYRSIHLTSRKLITVSGRRTFYPFEVQVTDQASFWDSQYGQSAHKGYKRRQLDTARRRVLGPLYERLSGDSSASVTPMPAPARL